MVWSYISSENPLSVILNPSSSTSLCLQQKSQINFKKKIDLIVSKENLRRRSEGSSSDMSIPPTQKLTPSHQSNRTTMAVCHYYLYSSGRR
ncbi:putative signal peptidase complex subunit 3B [Iris pallida]|uniref:Signal peptidase complex subunit 3B n=1 Tax=Iris pallida TaxID=29817 RepID=A0AAX6H184_IRIPA|nr:putative signal peptidase complex subunit 3B [Iris pallida]